MNYLTQEQVIALLRHAVMAEGGQSLWLAKIENMTGVRISRGYLSNVLRRPDAFKPGKKILDALGLAQEHVTRYYRANGTK